MGKNLFLCTFWKRPIPTGHPHPPYHLHRGGGNAYFDRGRTSWKRRLKIIYVNLWLPVFEQIHNLLIVAAKNFNAETILWNIGFLRSGQSGLEISLFNAQENGVGGNNKNCWNLFYRCTGLKICFWYICTPGRKLGKTACCQIIVFLRLFSSVFRILLRFY